jgi:terminase small subunit-like protein
MPALKNPKHEQFVQLIVRGTKYGWTQGEAYQRAGFKSSGHGAEVNASKLLKKTDIKARLAEIAAPGVKKAQVTVESLLAELEANIVGATVSQQHGAVNGAVALMGKLRGLLVDRVEIGGAGEFQQCESVDDVLDKLLSEEDPHDVLAWLDRMRVLVLERAGERAKVIEPPARPVTNEAERSIEYLRPTRKGRR